MPEYVPDGQVLDLTGQTFGALTVLRRHGTHRKYATWWCRCSCGAECEARGDRLRKGRKRYCGASVHRRVPRYSAGRNLAWRSWNRMLQRCHNPKHQAFAKYGGEGIKVCARWRKSFDAFFADMGERPSRAHSIDRRDNEKGYFKENCRWATALEQQINRRCTVYVEWQGAQVRLKALCDQLGLKYGDVAGRYRRGWPIETAVSKPFKRYGPRRRLDPAERKALITARHSRKKAREARKAANAALRAKLGMSTKPSAGIPKRSVIVAGHRTSISVEGPFWAAIMGAAAARQLSINDLITEIALWAKDNDDAANLSSAVRLWVLQRQINGSVEQKVTVNGTTVAVVAGKLTYVMPDGSTVCCTCIGAPYSEQIVEGLRRRAAATAAVS